MSFADRLRHSLVLERPVAGADDGYGQATQTWTAIRSLPGLVQPKTAREIALLSQAGAVVSEQTIYLLPGDVRAADRIRFEPDDGRRYELTGVRDAAGLGHHLECDAKIVGQAS